MACVSTAAGPCGVRDSDPGGTTRENSRVTRRRARARDPAQPAREMTICADRGAIMRFHYGAGGPHGGIILLRKEELIASQFSFSV